jgi:Ca2+-binding RTX toxin-like protein
MDTTLIGEERGNGRLDSTRSRRLARLALAALVAGAVVGAGALEVAWAAVQQGTSDHNVLIGRDDDNVNNPDIQIIPSPPGANQSLNNTDVQIGGRGNDILIGLQGSDVQIGDDGDDIFIGGPEGGTAPPNSDVQFGGRGNDVSIWAPGDGSDAFIGGPGKDALVIGLIDRDPANSRLPLLSNPTNHYPHGRPSVNVSGTNGFCTVERVDDPDFGYEFLVRFFVRSTGNLAVTIRLSETEQVFCPGLTPGEIVFADLTRDAPQFVAVGLDRVQRLNDNVAAMIR